MAPKKKPKLTKEEIALKKSNAAKARLEKIKKDPLLLAQHKEKERLKYLKKKEKGQRRSVKDMTPREQRKTRKKWKDYSTEYRKKKKRIQEITVNFVEHNTPPSSEVDILEEQRIPELPNRIRNTDALRAESQRRRVKNKMLLKQKSTIKMLKKKLNTQQRKYQRLKQKIKKTNDALTPKSKIEVMAKDPTQQKELVKKALFGEVIQTQIWTGLSNCHDDRLRVNYGCGDYVLVKLQLKNKEYRYAAVCSNYDDEEGELTVAFLKVCGEKGKLFKLDENDVADVPYEDVIEKLQIPSLIVKGDRVYYTFKKAIEVFEK